MNKTVWIILGVILILGVMIAGSFIGAYNNLQVMDEQINGQWAQVENQLKRRNDLIPNLVETVKGYATHEKTVFTNIADARSKLSGAMNKNDVKAIQNSNSELTGALSRLLLVVERYPQLKADKSFTALQDELAGTENRLAVARMDYNESVKILNAKIRTFPTSIVAALSGIKAREYFEASEAEKDYAERIFERAKQETALIKKARLTLEK